MALFSKKRKVDNDSNDDGFDAFVNFGEEKKKKIADMINGDGNMFGNDTFSAQKDAPLDFSRFDPSANQVTQGQIKFQATEQLIFSKSAGSDAIDPNSMPLVGTSIILGKRSSQQDAIATSNPYITGSFNEKWLGVLCGGMGGMNGGERASALSVKETIEAFRKMLLKENVNIPDFYREVIAKVDFDVSSLEDDQGRYIGAGTTFISVLIDNGLLYWASVGDSHIYIIRGSQMKMIVREHNYLMDLLEMAEAGEITYEAAYSDKSKDALTSYIGIGGVTLMDVTDKPVSLIPGDIILLCSDGLYRSVSDEEILQIISGNSSDMNAAAEALTQFAMMKNNPYQDNTSVVLAKYQ